MISSMSKPVPALAMTDGQREVLESLARSQSAAHREVVRAKALLMAADGVANATIAAAVSVSPATVANWRTRFAGDGLVQFGQVREGRGRKPSIPDATLERIVTLTEEYRPQGETHWSTRTMAGVGPQTAPSRHVQGVQRPEVRGETRRCRGSVSEPAGERDRAVRRREVLG